MATLKVPSHKQLMKKYLRNRNLQKKIKAGVLRLNIIRQIIRLREQAGFAQAELASRIGVSQPYIARIENDAASNLSLETLIKIVEALNGDIDIRIRARQKAA